MSEHKFQKGQLVAVILGSLASRRIRIFCGYYTKPLDDHGTWCLCRNPGEPERNAVAWPHCIPLEEVEPEAFLAREKVAEEEDDA